MNITWHETTIDREKREELNGHKGVCLWFTGLSGSGKSTLANAVESILNHKKVHTYLLDGDNIRHGLNKNLGFSDEDRTENIRRIGEVAKLFVDAGTVVITAFISPFREDRKKVRNIIPNQRFIEIYIDCPLEVCEQRDPKGLYKKARTNEIKEFTGISSPYEAPENPELVIKSGKNTTVKENAENIVNYLIEKGIIK